MVGAPVEVTGFNGDATYVMIMVGMTMDVRRGVMYNNGCAQGRPSHTVDCSVCKEY